jgi:hypothetical protein
MKNKFTAILFVSCLALLFLLGCQKEDQVEINQTDEVNSITDDIQKIETRYQEGSIKYEGPGVQGDPKIETDLPQNIKEKIRFELEKSFSKQNAYVKNSGNLVAVFKNGTCGSYPELQINMDEEDTNAGSYYNEWTGDSYVTVSDYNVVLNLCVVDNVYFERTTNDYAILNLSSTIPEGVSRIVRFFDNEDTNNGNFTLLNGSSYSGWYGDCQFEGNTRLSFFYYPSSTFNAFPNLGISYGVLGRFGESEDKGFIFCDDEDSRNGNWCWKDLWNGSYWTSGYSGNITNIMDVGGNTKLWLSRVN